jgi:hypothetical protein
MLRDLKWGVGGGLLIIVLGHVAGLVGVLSSLQVIPLVAGGVGLILLTTIYLLGRLAPASGGPVRLLAPPVASPNDESQIVRTTLVLEGRPAAFNAEIMRLERQWCVRFSRTPIWAATNPSEFLTGKPATNCEPSRHL